MSSLTHDPSSTRQPTSSAGHSRSSANENKQWKRERRRRRRKSRNPFKTFVQAWEDAVNRKEKRKQQTAGPKSWIERKFMVGVVLLLFGWSSYTFLGDILNKSLTNHDKALVPLAPGVVLTVFYWVLWIMFAWTYVKLVFTPPGFARDHIPPTDPPLPSDPPPESLPNNPYINPLSSIYSTSHPNPNPRIYPPSVGAPTSAHRPSIDAATHRSVSLNEHGEFDEEENIRGVPYVAMPSGIEGSGSNVAIPPTPRAAEPPTPNLPTSPTSLPSAIAPKKPRPGLLRNSANPPVPTVESAFKPSSPTTDASLKLHQSKRPSTSSRPPSSPPTSPAIAAFSNTRPSESSIEPQPRATSGFQFHSTSYITRPPQSYHSTSQRKPSTQPLARTRSYSQPSAHSRTHSNSFTRPNAVHTRTQSESRIPNIPTAMPTPSLSAPQTPTYTSAGTRPTWSFAGRTEALEDDIAVSRDGHEGPRHPYLDDLPPVQAKWQRRPSDYPALDPYYRYCSREGIIKPMRAHHCRICDACILGYDHHCPWVGGCVGARNRKFFVVFCFWAALYTSYTLGLLIAAIVRSTNPRGSSSTPSPSPTINGNHISLVIFTSLFALFTFVMFFTHLHLLMRNASTVEWHGVQSMQETERAMLSQAIPVCSWLGMSGQGHGGLLGRRQEEVGGWGSDRDEIEGLEGFKGRKELRRRWDEEWGRIGKEGNLWWLGSSKANWQAVMGTNKWTWFLPLGNTSHLGLWYPTNPRFDEHGRWMKRKYWPEELR